MITDFFLRIAVLGGLLIVLVPGLFAGAGYLWNRKYLPAQAAKGQHKKSFSKLMQEINGFTFKEDTGTLAKKAPPLVKKLLSFRSLHILLWLVGAGGFLATGYIAFLLTFPVSFLVGISRALPVINKRDKLLERMFSIASSLIRFNSGRTGKNVAPPMHWNHMKVEKWDGDNPVEMIITFPSGNGPDRGSQRNFEKTFKEHVTEEHEWAYEWDLTHDRVTLKAIPNLPTMLNYPGSADQSWNKFPVGESTRGTEAYDVSVFPHVLVGGPSGTGKSVLQRNIVFHTIQHNYRWRFIGIDLKRVELTPYNKYKKTVLGIATEVEQGLEVLRYVNNEMIDRYKALENIGQNNVIDMENPPYHLLVMVDEATMFLGASGSKTDEGKAEDAMKAEAADLVGKILRLGRACGIHMVIAMQRPDATVLRGEFKANMDVRLAAGRMDSTPSSMLLDSGEAFNLPGIRGRGLIRVGGNLQEFQGYFAKPEWIDEFILAHPEAEPSTILPGGHLHEKYKELTAAGAAPADTTTIVDDEEDRPAAFAAPAPKDEPIEAIPATPPAFFNTTMDEPPVAPLTVEPDLELSEDDYVLDDFDIEEPSAPEASPIMKKPVDTPEIAKPKVEPAPAVEWAGANPFGSPAKKPAVQKPVMQKPVEETAATSTPPSRPVRPNGFPASR